MVLHHLNKEIRPNIYCLLCIRMSGCYCNCQCRVKTGKRGRDIDHTCEPESYYKDNVTSTRSTSFFNFRTFKQLPIYCFLVIQTSSNTYNHYWILLDSFAFLDYAFLILKKPSKDRYARSMTESWILHPLHSCPTTFSIFTIFCILWILNYVETGIC